ncbi:hypothetical protein GGI11_008447, partial [Coemansia sp. RSA 2049]
LQRVGHQRGPGDAGQGGRAHCARRGRRFRRRSGFGGGSAGAQRRSAKVLWSGDKRRHHHGVGKRVRGGAQPPCRARRPRHARQPQGPQRGHL